MKRAFNYGEHVAHKHYGRVGIVDGSSSGPAGYHVILNWLETYRPFGPERIPHEDLVSLDDPDNDQGHVDQIRTLTEIARKQLDTIDTTTALAQERGWNSEDMLRIFTAVNALSLLGDRMRSQAYLAEAERSR